VQDSVYDKFMVLLIEKVKSTPTGDGFDEAVTSGPIVSERGARVRSAVCGVLTRNFDRSQKSNSTRYGVTLSPANRKGPKL
jgi:acyl-CoA reductase-like NAD-dependent aldehyde dehydrogenase